MHLAELNIAEWKVHPESPEAKPFMAALDSVNAAAERSPGFVWRFMGDGGSQAIRLRPYENANIIVNMSVWETPEALENFTWNTVHKQVYRRKKDWFNMMSSHHFVMWWVEEGHIPTLLEAKKKLDHLNENGNTDHAFTWNHLPHVKLWQTQRCG